jgi:hypothetical protein
MQIRRLLYLDFRLMATISSDGEGIGLDGEYSVLNFVI